MKPIGGAFDPEPFHTARRDLQNALAPALRWITLPPARRMATAYAAVLGTPYDLVAAGYTVTLRRPEDGWSVDVRNPIGVPSVVRLEARAHSLAPAFFQFDGAAKVTIRDLQRQLHLGYEYALTVPAKPMRATL